MHLHEKLIRKKTTVKSNDILVNLHMQPIKAEPVTSINASVRVSTQIRSFVPLLAFHVWKRFVSSGPLKKKTICDQHNTNTEANNTLTERAMWDFTLNPKRFITFQGSTLRPDEGERTNLTPELIYTIKYDTTIFSSLTLPLHKPTTPIHDKLPARKLKNLKSDQNRREKMAP